MVESATLHIPLAGKGGWDRLLNGDEVTSDLQLDSTGVAFMFACFLAIVLDGTEGQQRRGRSCTDVEVHKASTIATSACAPSRSGTRLWMTRTCLHVRTHTNTNTAAVFLGRCHVGTCWEHIVLQPSMVDVSACGDK